MRTSSRTRILKKHNRTSALRGHLVLEVRVGHVHECSWTVARATAAKFALEDVPDLREFVSVERITRSGLVPNKAGVRLGRTICSGMKEKLGLVLEPTHLPFHVINMLVLRSMVTNSFSVCHHKPPWVSCTIALHQ